MRDIDMLKIGQTLHVERNGVSFQIVSVGDIRVGVRRVNKDGTLRQTNDRRYWGRVFIERAIADGHIVVKGDN